MADRTPDPLPPLMGEWETGLGWVLAVLLAALRPRLVDTQHSRPFGLPPRARFTDLFLTRRPVDPGWPPGIVTFARPVCPAARPPTPLFSPPFDPVRRASGKE